MKRILHLILVLCIPLGGCETAVHPYVGTPEPFTLWGIFNSSADTQIVRVFTVEDEPGIDRPNGIDAEVLSINLTTGERTEWHHKLASYDNGVTGHIFWAAFRPEHGERYRLEVTRSDGAASTVEVTIPPPAHVEIDTSHTHSEPRVRITGDAPHLIGVVVRYDATNLPPRTVWPVDRPLHPLVEFPIDVSYQGELERTDEGWEFAINMKRDYERVRSEYEGNCLVTDGAPGIQLRAVELRFVAADSSWNPPGGLFDPELLIQPNTLSNVENGFGFVGAGHIVRSRWIPPRQVRTDLGYEYTEPCNFFGGPRPVLECTNPPIPCLDEQGQSIWETFY